MLNCEISYLWGEISVDNNTAIRVENLCFCYAQSEGETEQKLYALSDVNLEIKKGEFAAVIGRNGSGKSTLAKHFNALLLPESGKVTINGLDTALPENTWKIRQSTGMVFQNPDNQIIATVVEEDVAFGVENLGIPSAETRERVDNALKTLGMYEHARQSPHFLSGGQKQRIAIAGILAMAPSCIILDEPTAMLDPIGRRDVIDTVARLNKNNGITIVLITHFMNEAIAADRVFVMDKGRIIISGTPREVFSDTRALRSAGLDVPQAADCAEKLRNLGYAMPESVLTIEELANAVKANA